MGDGDLKKTLENLKKIERRQSEWLTDLKKRNEIAPEIEEANEDIKRDIEALASPNAPIISQLYLVQKSSSALGIWDEYLGSIADTDYEVIRTTGSASAGTISAEIFDIAGKISVISSSSTQHWAQDYRNKYIETQERRNRVEDVRAKIEVLSSDLAIEFDEAVRTYRSAKAGVRPYKDAGNTMRNVLNHTKGELFNKTGDRRSLSKTVKWEVIADKLAIGGLGSTQREFLFDTVSGIDSDWGRLLILLTNVTKNLEVTTETGLETIFTNWIDLLYRVFILIDPENY